MSLNLDELNLKKFLKPVPRYTSYPTAPEWASLSSGEYAENLAQTPSAPLSLYLHIPFCHSMCLYCGCSVILNRKEENEIRYADYLIKEIDLVQRALGKKRAVHQLHFGGGTPTKLSLSLFRRLFDRIEEAFDIDFSKEIAIEIDPRTAMDDNGEKLALLKELGFNRISFGVQDTDPKVQEAVKRRQTLEMTQWTYERARALGFSSINVDLIYGLPFQTETSFKQTIDHILSMCPDRVSLFSYAKVPWLKPHQKAIPDSALPSPEEKFRIYSHARRAFIESEYVAIGMDHFALEEDELAISYRNKTLQRNFQGYTVRYTEKMLGFGVTAIGFSNHCYAQNLKELNAYYQFLDKGLFPVHRGKKLTNEDRLRKWVIHTLMCRFELDKQEFSDRFGFSFETHFAKEREQLDRLNQEGLVCESEKKLTVTFLGELFIRLVASVFDTYLTQTKTSKFSSSV